jgi:hypothetical protein
MIIKLENRLIAFLDVLGFSNRLETEDTLKLHQEYSTYIDRAKNEVFFPNNDGDERRNNFDFSQFLFDSIVLVSCPIDDAFNVNNFVNSVSLLLELGFTNKLPLRGAISQGDFIYDQERNIFLSRNFPELAKFELKQEWSGCCVLGIAESTIKDSMMGASASSFSAESDQARNQAFHYYPVPLKKGESETLLVLNFLFFIPDKEIQEGINYLISGKRDNNIKYIEFLNSLPFPIQELEPQFMPAKSFTYVATTCGVRFKFMDDHGNPCQPGTNELSFSASAEL